MDGTLSNRRDEGVPLLRHCGVILCFEERMLIQLFFERMLNGLFIIPQMVVKLLLTFKLMFKFIIFCKNYFFILFNFLNQTLFNEFLYIKNIIKFTNNY